MDMIVERCPKHHLMSFCVQRTLISPSSPIFAMCQVRQLFHKPRLLNSHHSQRVHCILVTYLFHLYMSKYLKYET